MEGDMEEVERIDTPEVKLVPATPYTDMTIATLREEAEAMVKYANELVIESPADVQVATADLALVAKLVKSLNAEKSKYLDPLNKMRGEYLEFFKGVITPVDQANRIAKLKILAYEAKIRAAREEAEKIEAEKLELARREAALNHGEFTTDISPVDKPAEPAQIVRTEAGTSHKSTIRKFEVVDISQVPAEYLKVDEVAIGKLVRAGIKSIPGIRIWEEPNLIVRSY